jgi:SAM-dependent methyltransferase
MSCVSERERFLRAFHDAQPGITSRALARAGSYERVAARVPRARVLDVACGDGTLLALLGSEAVGLDVSTAELRHARGSVVCGRAQELPFADASFDAATCHLAFMLFDDVELVVAELARVLKPGAPFVALLGGGPTADATDDTDAFHCFVTLLRDSVTQQRSGFGDRRASSEAGWAELFHVGEPGGWRDLTFERWPLDLSGSFDDVWRFLGASYQLAAEPANHAERIRAGLRAAFPGDIVPCTVATYLATVRR